MRRAQSMLSQNLSLSLVGRLLSRSATAAALLASMAVGGCAADAAEESAGEELATTAQALSDANCSDDGYTLDCSAGLVHRQFGSHQTHLKIPSGTRPAAGWPTVVMFQGSFFRTTFSATTDDYSSTKFGARYQVELVQNLLSGGYAVLAIDAPFGTYYKTNNGCTNGDAGWLNCDEHAAMQDILTDMASGAYGHTLNVGKLYATGISSGGFMTSRFQRHYDGQTYAGRVTDIKAVAIQSAGWATCHALCSPSYGPGYNSADMPGSGWLGYGDGQHANTVPTLFLQGAGDSIVPNFVSNLYYNKIKQVKGDAHVRQVVEQTTNCAHGLANGKCGQHQWIAASSAEIRGWFDTHP